MEGWNTGYEKWKEIYVIGLGFFFLQIHFTIAFYDPEANTHNSIIPAFQYSNSERSELSFCYVY